MHLSVQLIVLVCVFAKWAPGFAGASEIDEAAVRNPAFFLSRELVYRPR